MKKMLAPERRKLKDKKVAGGSDAGRLKEEEERTPLGRRQIRKLPRVVRSRQTQRR